MSEIYKVKKSLISSGGSKMVIIPAVWKYIHRDEVIVEIIDDKIVISAAK